MLCNHGSLLMPPIFPLEIEETILDCLTKDNEDNEGHSANSALKTCSLVCQAFLHICRKHIFRSIVLPVGPSATHAFEWLLCKTPEIADYICNLDYKIWTADLTSLSIQETLKQISRLEFLTFDQFDWPRVNWRDNLICPALLYLLHLPTLTHFKMININNFLVSDLIPCVNLKYLDIGKHTTVAAENTFPASFPEHSIQLNKFIAGTSASTMKLNILISVVLA